MNSRRAAVVALALTTASVVGHAQDGSLYRKDQPATLERESPAVAQQQRAQAITAGFAQAYAKAGSPRVLLLWHRTVSDSFSDQQQLTRTQVSVGELPRDNRASQLTLSWKGQPAQVVSLLPPAAAADYETALLQPLLAAGVRLVDRSMAIRMTALKASGAASSPASAIPGAALEAPMIEAQAFSELADHVLQVQLLPDTQAAHGWRARLTVIDVKTGTVLAETFRANAEAPGNAPGSSVARVTAASQADTERSWQATERGFVAINKPITVRQSALNDALALMERWPVR
jgi:hypothetical protein